MEKIQKTLIGVMTLAVSVGLLYVFFIFGGIASNNSGSDDSRFPFFIIYSSWPAIFVPILAQKRQETERKKKLKNQMGE